MKTVLIVENESDLQQMLVELLQELEVKVVCADDGERALAYLAGQELPDLILLDFQMPNMDGFEFRARQLKDDRLRQIPVVFMTAIEHIPPQRGELNGVHCIKKPFDRDDLLSAVSDYLH